ncbi:hypothetical protein ACFVXW_09765 [Streptomyces sp. NPDC058251]
MLRRASIASRTIAARTSGRSASAWVVVEPENERRSVALGSAVGR